MYLPLHNVSGKKYFARISIKRLGIFTVSLPLLAFIICVLLTMIKDFEQANHTHCSVFNFIPSISSSIGSFEPQNTIWKTAIYIHGPLRFYLIHLRWKYYRSVIIESCAIIVKLAIFLNIIENLCLLGLTYWTSSQNYPNHEKCFKTFVGTSIIYMFLTCIMLSKCRRRANTTSLELHSIKLKWRALITNVCSLMFAGYFFSRHNRLCEPYVYSMFGLSEYVVVISNITFHLTTVYDLQVQFLSISRRGISTE